MKKIYIYMLGLSSLLMTTVANAQTCTLASDCNSLGYVQTVNDCTGLEMVKCPFDISKVFCVTLPPILCNPEVGSIYYSDKSCSKNVISGKTAIGVVFDTTKRLAVALSDAGSPMAWGGYGTDIPALTNCTDRSTLTTTCGADGKANTSAIIAYIRNNGISYPAAEYCNRYTTAGTTVGKWYLPSVAELRLLYNAKIQVNASLQLLGKSAFTSSVYWSSTEFDTGGSWAGGVDGGYSGVDDKRTASFVRAVMAF